MNQLVSLLLVLGIALSGCTKKSETKKVVSLGIWSNYLTPEMIAEFEKASGIQLQVSNYSSNEELLAKLQAGAGGYDVVVPSDYMVSAMAKLGLLRKLDRAKIPSVAGIDPRYLKKPYDPENAYSLPYDVGTTGIAVNHELFKGKVKGFKGLLSNPQLAGKFSLLDDARETIGAALKAQGFSLNTKNPDELKKAKELLIQARPRVKSFTSETLMPLVNGEAPVAHAYVSDALQARKQTNGKIDYILPEEGGTFWIDNLVIPNSAAHVEEAHALINFLLEPKVVRSTVLAIFVSPANRGALALLPPGFQQENAPLFPSDAELKKFEMLQDLGDLAQLWDRLWTEVKAER